MPQLLVAVVEKVAYVRICGRASFTCSPDFRSLVYELHERGCREFVLDLTECLIMDSTFLGILAGFSLKFAENRPEEDRTHIELRNANDRILDLLDNLGVSHLFRAVQNADPILECTPVAGSPKSADKCVISQTVLEAHKTLMEVNADNIPKFKDVARFVAEDLGGDKSSPAK